LSFIILTIIPVKILREITDNILKLLHENIAMPLPTFVFSENVTFYIFFKVPPKVPSTGIVVFLKSTVPILAGT